MDTILRNARVEDGADKPTVDIGMDQGRIAAIEPGLAKRPPGLDREQAQHRQRAGIRIGILRRLDLAIDGPGGMGRCLANGLVGDQQDARAAP